MRVELSVRKATDESINAASHLGPMDSGAVAALRRLADRLDSQDGASDNTLAPTYLRYCDALGLTPSARVGLAASDGQPATGSRLAQLRAIAGGAGA